MYMGISYLGVSMLTQGENVLTNAKEVLKRKNSVVLENLHGNAEIGGQYI